MTTILRHPKEVREFSAALKRQGKTLALVPTMGFLHDGHVSLMREAKKRADSVATTIFVNPTQFGPNEDLSVYPRDFEGDVKKCESAGVDVVYAPAPDDVYGHGFQTYVKVEQVSQGLCGDKRPGHFRGVATIVTKLFALFRTDIALFGEKDFQQLQVIKRLNLDLDLGVDVIGMPTIREADGLAMSSRNKYLSPEERIKALTIFRAMNEAKHSVANGQLRANILIPQAVATLEQAGFKVDYVEIRDSTELQALTVVVPNVTARIFVAAYMGKTRLIDNLEISAG
jgi:pantoate--beta-alanine ligase